MIALIQPPGVRIPLLRHSNRPGSLIAVRARFGAQGPVQMLIAARCPHQIIEEGQVDALKGPVFTTSS